MIPERADDALPVAPVVTATTVEGDRPALLDPHQLAALLRRNLFLIVVAIAAALALGLLLSLLTVPEYIATARIQVEQQAERVLRTEDEAPAVSQDAERFLQTQTDVLRSRSIAIGVAQSLKLFGNARFHGAMGVAPGDSGGPVERERVIGLLRANLGVDLPRNSRIVSLAFTSRDPRMAADVVNAFAQTFITANLQRKFSSSAYARDFLAGQLVEAKARLERSERDLNAYARAAGLVASRPALGATSGDGAGTTPQSVTTSSLLQLNTAYNAAKAARIEAEQRWRSAAAMPVMSVPDVLTNPAIQQVMQQRATLTADLREARERYRSDFPALQEKAGQLDEINRQIGEMAANIRRSIQARYQVAADQERSLAAEVAGLKTETLSEQDRSVRFTILSREVDTNRTLYDGLLQRFKELSAAAGIASNNISVVDVAEPPLAPSSPRLFFNMAVALLGGLVAAVLVVLAREQIDDVVRGPLDIERKLHLPSLGVIPRLGPGMLALDELRIPKSPIAEAYFALRSALLYSTPQGLPRSILVTSSQAGEGKSTTSLAIAGGFAKLGRRVALLDGDLRRPSLHKLVEGAGEHGFSDLLIGGKTIAEVAVPVANEGFWLIPSGPLPPSPTDLLSGGRLPELLRSLEDAFDLVVIDGPPVLGLADAPMLAANVQAVLFAVEANRGVRGRTKSAIRRLRLNHAHILGALLTMFEARKAGVDQYYGYEYYSYGEGKSAS